MKTVITKDVDAAARALADGQVIGMPTETVYGLAGSAYSEAAVNNIYQIKGRPRNNPLIIHIPRTDALHKIADGIPAIAYDLADAFWPGPLTLVLQKRASIPGVVTAGLDTVAVRVPAHLQAQQLLSAVDFPVAAPSANPFGRISPTRATHVREYFTGRIPLVLDGGPCIIGIESTIIGFNDGQPVIYRQGFITEDQVKSVAGEVGFYLTDESAPQAPGMLARHYAPRTPLCIAQRVEDAVAHYAGKKVGIISFKGDHSVLTPWHTILSPEANLESAAAALYNALHEMDKRRPDVIIAERFPDIGIGKALNDKLERASKR